MRCQHVVPAHVLDVEEFIPGGHLADRNQLHAVLLGRWAGEEQVAEVARALAVFRRLADGVDVVLLLGRVADVEDEAGVAAVVEVVAPEQRGRLVQRATPGGTC